MKVTILLIGLVTACGGAGVQATHTAVAPIEHTDRQAAVDQLGQRAWNALRQGHPELLLYDDVALHALLETEAATRYAARRPLVARRVGDLHELPAVLATAEYAGLCVQGAREESADGVLGLRAPGWILDRVLVIGRRPSGRRIAAWVEGTFVYSNAGFSAIDLERVEEPRWEHSDLEIAPCDLAVRRDQPEVAPSGAIP